MKAGNASRLGALVAALTLPLAGPVHADPGALAPSAQVGDPGTPAAAATLAPAALATPATAAPAAEPIAGGMASYYGRHLKGARTASGERFDPDALTAAHRTLPFGTRLLVTNAQTGDSVVVTVNDRGPFHGNRVIDLSDAAAGEIGILRAGSGRVELAVLPETEDAAPDAAAANTTAG